MNFEGFTNKTNSKKIMNLVFWGSYEPFLGFIIEPCYELLTGFIFWPRRYILGSRAAAGKGGGAGSGQGRELMAAQGAQKFLGEPGGAQGQAAWPKRERERK